MLDHSQKIIKTLASCWQNDTHAKNGGNYSLYESFITYSGNSSKNNTGVRKYSWSPIKIPVWVFFPTPTSNFATPAGCHIIQLNLDTFYPEIASDSNTSDSLQSCKMATIPPPHTLQRSITSPGCGLLTTDCRLEVPRTPPWVWLIC